MADPRRQTNSPDAGDAIDSSPSISLVRGTSNAPDAKPTISAVDALLEGLANGERRRPGPKCSIGMALKEIDPERAEKIRHLIDQTDRSSASIAEVFALLGYADITHYRIQHHRNRKRQAGCRCPL